MPPRNSKKMPIPVLDNLAKVICDSITGSQLTSCFKNKNLSCNCNETTKWKRLTYVFNKYQRQNNNSSTTFILVEYLLNPTNYIGKEADYYTLLDNVNKILVTQGYVINRSGRIERGDTLTSLDEITARYSSLLNKLKDRGIHPEVLKYCTQELLQENYFHSVLEAAKGLSDRIKQMTGLDQDGIPLYETVFSLNSPVLTLNDLSTSSLRNQQNGLKFMLSGLNAYFRNVHAHEPHIKWAVDESEAANALTIISFLHTLLDNCRMANT